MGKQASRLAVLALSLLPGPLRAQSLDEIREACSNEIQLACSDGPQGRAALLKCLMRREDVLTQRCADFLHADRSAPDAEPADDSREARLTAVTGSVYLHTSEQKEGEFIDAEAGAPVEEGDMVRTGTDGSAELTLDGETVISVAANTDFIVNSLSPQATEFHLGIGSLVAKVKSILTGQTFTFRTPTAVAAIRGTELGLEQESPDKPARIGVFDEGHVAVSSPKGGQEIVLAPGQETEVRAGKAPLEARPLKTFLPRRTAIEQARRRVLAVRKDWVRAAPQARLAQRTKLMQRPAVQAGKLKNVRESQRKLTHEGNQRRQQELWKDRRNRPDGRRRSEGERGGRPETRGRGGAQGQRGRRDQGGPRGPGAQHGAGGQHGPQGQNGPRGPSGPGGGHHPAGPGGPKRRPSGEAPPHHKSAKDHDAEEGAEERREPQETGPREHREHRRPPVHHGQR